LQEVASVKYAVSSRPNSADTAAGAIL
jgi:hypothetical protein